LQPLRRRWPLKRQSESVPLGRKKSGANANTDTTITTIAAAADHPSATVIQTDTNIAVEAEIEIDTAIGIATTTGMNFQAVTAKRTGDHGTFLGSATLMRTGIVIGTRVGLVTRAIATAVIDKGIAADLDRDRKNGTAIDTINTQSRIQRT